ncbi:Rad52/22 family double-strand break repair protein-domain-containing protein [Epithele typhae]|uniref:Rad52/22 family double-strand break repair protein-domain-containing protein n=1 Tax=Epithele typhae TaxID=378194 RepID=UPI002008308A|nr:Rad52/22 family double-strand break repair protein-domain-containing protein [Epithele typhae]KAH9944457.1 Rad52/22 family double-strand break repair protein-domain-containing protein [Epithele typhae]
MSEESERKIAALQAKLNKKLGPEFISQRPGPGGGPKLTYAEGWKVINLANEVFGFNGWSSTIVSLTTDFIDYSEQSARYSVGVTAIVRVTLRDGVFHEDVGYGLLENSKSKGAALDKCKKEAVTDAIKRTLRNFGNLLGNCLYDKAYTQEVVKIKVPPVWRIYGVSFSHSYMPCRPNWTRANSIGVLNSRRVARAHVLPRLPSRDPPHSSCFVLHRGIQQAQAAQRRPQQGMGLQHAGASSATGGGVRREQYTPAEAADAKRARHG